VILADEINRTPPKTQAALLEAMQEHQVTVGGIRYPLEEPFFVLATQNPIEMEGTYPLPEAQLDRFMFNVLIDYLPEDDEVAVVCRRLPRPEPISRCSPARMCCGSTTSCEKCPWPKIWSGTPCDWPRPAGPARPYAPDFVNRWVSWGAGLRAAQYLVLGAKARALLNGRAHVTSRISSPGPSNVSPPDPVGYRRKPKAYRSTR
jgi:MoxR-like ATPase